LQVYWFLGNPDAEIPTKWPDSLSTHFNMETPMTLVMNASSKADVYIAVGIIFIDLFTYYLILCGNLPQGKQTTPACTRK
jgi:hypothetical protein